MKITARSDRRVFAAALALLALAPVLGCAAPMRVFVNPQADMTLYRNVVVIPFANLTGDPFAGGRLTRAFTTELVIADRFKLLDPAQILGELDRLGALPNAQGQIDPVRLKEAATRIQATAYLRGAVTEYTMRRVGTDEYPVVGFDVEMVDTATGNIVWRIAVTQTGKGRLPILGGPAERTFGRVTQAACERAVRELSRVAF